MSESRSEHPELIELGHQLEEVIALWQRQRALDDAGRDDPVDEHGVSIAWTKIHRRMLPLCDRILRFQPCTPGGLAIMARAISLSEDTLWDDEGDAAKNIVVFIKAVCSFAGTRPVQEEPLPHVT